MQFYGVLLTLQTCESHLGYLVLQHVKIGRFTPASRYRHCPLIRGLPQTAVNRYNALCCPDVTSLTHGQVTWDMRDSLVILAFLSIPHVSEFVKYLCA